MGSCVTINLLLDPTFGAKDPNETVWIFEDKSRYQGKIGRHLLPQIILHCEEENIEVFCIHSLPYLLSTRLNRHDCPTSYFKGIYLKIFVVYRLRQTRANSKMKESTFSIWDTGETQNKQESEGEEEKERKNPSRYKVVY